MVTTLTQLNRKRSMKKQLVTALLLTIFSTGLNAQSSSGEPSPEAVVNTVLSRATEQMYTSWDAKELGKLGDASAVALTKILGGREPTVDEIGQIVVIIRLAFNQPRMITVRLDAQPRAALFVLKYLDSLPSSSGLKDKIAQARAEIEESVKSVSEDSRP
jgi:hypothetical protein